MKRYANNFRKHADSVKYQLEKHLEITPTCLNDIVFTADDEKELTAFYGTFRPLYDYNEIWNVTAFIDTETGVLYNIFGDTIDHKHHAFFDALPLDTRRLP